MADASSAVMAPAVRASPASPLREELSTMLLVDVLEWNSKLHQRDRVGSFGYRRREPRDGSRCARGDSTTPLDLRFRERRADKVDLDDR
jgi:hypothetical protein